MPLRNRQKMLQRSHSLPALQPIRHKSRHRRRVKDAGPNYPALSMVSFWLTSVSYGGRSSRSPWQILRS
jgi:hypothetical protein